MAAINNIAIGQMNTSGLMYFTFNIIFLKFIDNFLLYSKLLTPGPGQLLQINTYLHSKYWINYLLLLKMQLISQ